MLCQRRSSLIKHHLTYFKHIFNLFKPYLSKDFIIKERKFTDKRTNAKYSSVQLASLSLPFFNYYKNLFYNEDNLKIVPLNIKKTFNSFRPSLLDNGQWKSSK